MQTNIDNSTPDLIFLRMLKYLVIFMPAIIYMSFVQQFALNIPHWDDYDAILSFLVQFKQGNLGYKLSLLFHQHNEHRILSSRIVYVLYYYIMGSINFRNIIFLNAIILLLLYCVFLSFIKKVLPLFWPAAALALSLCMFDVNNFENAQFAMCGMQNYGVILLFASSIFFYNKDSKKYLPLAVLLQGICVFSSGNGNVASFFILLFVLLSGSRQKKLVAIVSFLVFAPLYYIHYSKSAAVFFSLDPSKFVPFFLHTIGSHFSTTLAVVMAIVLVLGYLYTLPLKKGDGFRLKDNTAFFVVVAGFCFSSMGIVSIFRAALPLEAAHASRYFVYSHLLVATLFIFIMVKLENTSFQLRAGTIGLLVLVGVYAKNYNEGKEAFIWFYKILRTAQFDYPDTAQQHAKEISDDACRLKIYCLEEARAKIK